MLAGSAAYALGEALGWPTGLDRLPADARAFYGTIVAGTLVGVFINFIDLDPIKALFWCAVINGVVAVPLMIVIMMMAMPKTGNGGVHAAAPALGDGLAQHRGHDRRRGHNVRDLVSFKQSRP